MSYPVPAIEIRRETIVVNSRFIASLAPTFSVDEAKAFIKRIRAEFHDASHNVPAYLIGGGNSVLAHTSDDGEPSGTAGRPVYEQICSAGLYETAVVVVRYFGGILLGTGGLHNAYKQAAADALARAKVTEKVLQEELLIRFGYDKLNRIMQVIDREQMTVVTQDFSDACRITVRIPRSETERIIARLQRAGDVYVEKA